MTVSDFATLETLAGELTAADIEAARLRRRFYDLIRAMYEQGEPPSQIARCAGITKQRVNQIIVAGRR